MQLDFLTRLLRPQPTGPALQVGSRILPLRIVRQRRARRYILRVGVDGVVTATVPRGGSAREARAFAERSLPWIERQLARPPPRPAAPAVWSVGTTVLFRGEKFSLEVAPDADGRLVRLGDQTIRVGPSANLRPFVERHLWGLARRELTARTDDLATTHGLAIHGVTVRNQRSKWGSCSPKRTISLNWRLIQAPAFVRDYIILHELMHLREMNHSARFWNHVRQVCPDCDRAEAWLKEHRGLLR